MKRLLTVLIVFLAVLGALYPTRLRLERWTFEKLLNLGTREFFQGSLRLKSGSLDRNLKIHLDHLEGTLMNEDGRTAIEMRSLSSENSVLDYFSRKGLNLRFEGIKPSGSQSPGLSGRAELHSQSGGSLHLETKIDGLDLNEIQWINPDNLRGSSGIFNGSITTDSKLHEDPHFQVVILSKDGLVQSKFFGALLPYLPALPTKERMAKLAEKDAVVPFRDAAIRMELSEPSKIKVLLHIQIPDYNIILNINFEIHIEKNLSFLELAQITGLVKVKT